jgi:general secretion pathway protein G
MREVSMARSWNAVEEKLRPKGGRGCIPFSSGRIGWLEACGGKAGVSVTELTIVLVIITAVVMVGVPAIGSYVDTIRNTAAVSRLTSLELCLDKYYAENGKYPESLAVIGKASLRDPWGRAFVYVPLSPDEKVRKETARKARGYRVINTDYDLYSPGKDGRTDPVINKERCWDDIVRAYNGSYAGVARDIL